MRVAALAPVLIALTSPALAVPSGTGSHSNSVSKRALGSAVSAREPLSLDPAQIAEIMNSPDLQNQILENEKHGIIGFRRAVENLALKAREPINLSPEQSSFLSGSPELQKQALENGLHGIIALRRALLERDVARAKRELAVREFKRELLDSLLKARSAIDELD